MPVPQIEAGNILRLFNSLQGNGELSSCRSRHLPPFVWRRHENHSSARRRVWCNVILTVVPRLLSAAGPTVPTKAGCIAVTMPAVQGIPGNAPDVAGGVRDLVVNYLTGPSVKVVSLEARLPSQAAEEAKEKRCEPLLLVTLTRKSASSRFTKALGQAAGSASWHLPGGGGSVASATARAASAAGLQAALSLASSTKAKDEVRLECRLQSAGGEVQFGPNTEHQTATVDGEDLLTPVVARAAEAIVTRKGAK
jgi:hypothetical protein